MVLVQQGQQKKHQRQHFLTSILKNVNINSGSSAMNLKLKITALKYWQRKAKGQYVTNAPSLLLKTQMYCVLFGVFVLIFVFPQI